MKYALLALLLAATAQASDLAWDDIAKVPAVKVNGELKSCSKKGWKVIINQDKKNLDENICSESGSWGRGGPMEPMTSMTPQQIADTHIGRVKAVGMMKNFEVPGKGQYTSDEIEMLLFYKK